MIIDSSLELSSNQAITATAPSTNQVDMGAMGITAFNKQALKQHLGKGACVPLLVQVTEDFATLTSLTVQLRNSASSSMSSPVVLLEQTVPVAKLKKGFKFSIDELPAAINLEFIDLNYIVTGSSATAGKIHASVGTVIGDPYKG